MTKDYAKRKRTRNKTNTRTPTKTASKKPMSPIVVFISGILITLFAVFLWAIVKKPDVLKELVSDDKQPVAQTDQSAVATDKEETTDETEDKGTEFTYHEALTNKKVNVDITKPKTTDSNKTYIMQCGAFKQLADAERMKAELAFIGFQATVLSKGEWHRVRLGPYNSKRTAESDRHKLQNNNYQTCQIW
ncbi:SPOR domain-containing protein [Kangiella marina]|uniref:SPOR domain-containing protein n=1 Tax=Kangiella marina TaxID=1079178 RepID=A0ABP8IH13_9GAMM